MCLWSYTDGRPLKRSNPILVLPVLLGAMVCALAGAAEPVAAPVPEADVALQLKVIQTALLQGPTEQNRLDAALVLLQRPDAEARAMVMAALTGKENQQARQAVCRALAKSRGSVGPVAGKSDFLDPLLTLLVEQSGLDARLAAEAMLVFEFGEVSRQLVAMAERVDLAPEARLNVIYALTLWPEKQAVAAIVGRLDDTDQAVAAAAKTALQEAFGIGPGTDAAAFRKTAHALLSRSGAEITRDLMIVQRDRLVAQKDVTSRIMAERDLWRDKFVATLDRDYAAMDETGRLAMLMAKVASELPAEKIWAVGRIASFSGSVGRPLRDAVLSLLSDPDKEVRLATAVMLAGRSTLDPAEKLLSQLKVEQDQTVALAIFAAIGEACYFAFSPGSPIQLAPEIRQQTLSLAGDYLVSEDAAAAGQAADVIRKLLELNGLPEQQWRNYLTLLAARYEGAKALPGPLRARLLGVMARLCARPAYRTAAADLFKGAFIEGLADPADNAVREAAVIGLANLDKAQAFEMFKRLNLMRDPSAGVRRVVTGLAGEFGGAEDLTGLFAKLGANGDSEATWAAAVAILKRQPAGAVLAWARQVPTGSQSVAQVRELLVLAESKADAEKNVEVLLQARLLLLEMSLKAGDVAKTAGLLGRRLAEQKDLTADDPMVVAVDGWLQSAQNDAAGKAALVQALTQIKNPPGVTWTGWTQIVKAWQAAYSPKPATQAASPQVQGSVTPTAPTVPRPGGDKPATGGAPQD